MTPPKYPKGDVRALLRRFLRSGQTAVDVGAAVGEMTSIMAECVGESGTVYAFEPTTCKRTAFDKAMLGAKARIYVEHIALGETTGEITLNQAATTGASRWHGDQSCCQTVPMTTLDLRFGDMPVDLVKIDTQGSEAHILDGASALLRRCPIWILEIWPWGLATAKRTARGVIDQLRAVGLRPYWADGSLIDEAGIDAFTAIPKIVSHANIYAIR